VTVDALFVSGLDSECAVVEDEGCLDAAADAKRDAGVEPSGFDWVDHVGEDRKESADGECGVIRGEDLAGELRRSGFGDLWSPTRRTLLEVYPHPAIIEAFGLPRRLAYKKGRIAQRRAGLRRLDGLILSLDEADPPFIGSPVEITDTMTGIELKAIEDLIDARICAWVAAVWTRYGDRGVRVFGDAASGHIAVPIGSVVAS